MKVYELIIARWNAVIPKDWALECAPKAGEEFSDCSGTEIDIKAGTLLRGGPESLFENMLASNFVKEVEE